MTTATLPAVPLRDDPGLDHRRAAHPRAHARRLAAFLGFQAAALLAVVWVGWSPVAVGVAAALYVVRMFAITGFYHRYFSHRAFATGRAWQFAFAVLGCSAMQKGPLWWAAHHRHHHRYSDRPEDVHSPAQRGFWHSHFGWFLSDEGDRADLALVRDLARYPELRWLDRWHAVVPIALAAGCFALGETLQARGVATDGWQMLVWGFAISTTAVANATYAINSLAHVIGRRRYATADDSRNHWLLALVTMGEGWHNNHHRYCGSARQGFRWYEVDPTWYLLLGLQALGVIRDLRPVPRAIVEEGRRAPAGGAGGASRATGAPG